MGLFRRGWIKGEGVWINGKRVDNCEPNELKKVDENRAVKGDFSKLYINSSSYAVVNIKAEEGLKEIKCSLSGKASGKVELDVVEDSDSVEIIAKQEQSGVNFVSYKEGRTIIVGNGCTVAGRKIKGNAGGNFISRKSIKVKNGKVVGKKNIIISEESDLVLDIRVPAKMFDLISVENSSDVNIEEIKSNNLEVETTSGDIGTSKILVNNYELATTSGNIHTPNIVADTYDARATSGNIKASGTLRDTTIEATSGDIEVKSKADSDSTVDIRTTSGDVNLYLEDVGKSKLRTRATSGDINSKFREGGGFQVKGTISTSSGNINIKNTPSKRVDREAGF